MRKKSIYYDISRILSYNKLFNFIIGPRGNGKSYAAKKLVINTFLKSKKQFVYVRRYKTELEHLSTYFSDIKDAYPDHKLEVKGREFYIDDELAGYAIVLSTSQKEKSTSYPNVKYVIYEEFIIGKSRHIYLKNEVNVFFDLYETIARMRDVQAIFISNSVTSNNPYFIFFKIMIKREVEFIKGGEWIVENCQAKDYKDAKRNTRFGKLISGTRYGDYAIENDFLEDNAMFINPNMPDKMECRAILKYNGKNYGVWYKDSVGKFWITEKYDKSAVKFAITNDDHEPNFIYLKEVKNCYIFKSLRYAYSIGYINFDKMSTKYMFYELLLLI